MKKRRATSLMMGLASFALISAAQFQTWLTSVAAVFNHA